MNPFLLGLFICVRRRFGLTMDTNFLPVSIIEFLGTYEKAQCSKNCLVITLQKLDDYDCRNTNHFLSILITPFRKKCFLFDEMTQGNASLISNTQKCMEKKYFAGLFHQIKTIFSEGCDKKIIMTPFCQT